jgi:hypothetical protein
MNSRHGKRDVGLRRRLVPPPPRCPPAKSDRRAPRRSRGFFAFVAPARSIAPQWTTVVQSAQADFVNFQRRIHSLRPGGRDVRPGPSLRLWGPGCRHRGTMRPRPDPPLQAVPCNLSPVTRSPAPARYSLFPIPYSLFPIPYSLFPIPYSLFPIPYSLFPIPYSLQFRPCPRAPQPVFSATKPGRSETPPRPARSLCRAPNARRTHPSTRSSHRRTPCTAANG